MGRSRSRASVGAGVELESTSNDSTESSSERCAIACVRRHPDASRLTTLSRIALSLCRREGAARISARPRCRGEAHLTLERRVFWGNTDQNSPCRKARPRRAPGAPRPRPAPDHRPRFAFRYPLVTRYVSSPRVGRSIAPITRAGRVAIQSTLHRNSPRHQSRPLSNTERRILNRIPWLDADHDDDLLTSARRRLSFLAFQKQ